eukprot:1694782-Prymnesium_polylepis.1
MQSATETRPLGLYSLRCRRKCFAALAAQWLLAARCSARARASALWLSAPRGGTLHSTSAPAVPGRAREHGRATRLHGGSAGRLVRPAQGRQPRGDPLPRLPCSRGSGEVPPNQPRFPSAVHRSQLRLWPSESRPQCTRHGSFPQQRMPHLSCIVQASQERVRSERLWPNAGERCAMPALRHRRSRASGARTAPPALRPDRSRAPLFCFCV